MEKYYYKENVFFVNDRYSAIERYQDELTAVLENNRAVGIIVGYYEEGLPICFLSNFMLGALGCTFEEFMAFTNGNLLAAIYKEDTRFFDIDTFKTVDKPREYRMYYQGKKAIWVHENKIDSFDDQGRRMWVLSIRVVDEVRRREQELKNAAYHAEFLMKRYQKISADMSDMVDMLADEYYKVLKLNLTDDTFEDIKIQPEEKYRELGYNNKVSVWAYDFALLGYIFEEDREKYLNFINPNYLRTQFKQGQNLLSLSYRRLIDSDFRWVKMVLKKSAEYTDEHQIVMLYVLDIHDEYMMNEKIKAAYEEAQSANNAKTQFLSNMSHEIRTPMNAIIGMTALAETHIDNKAVLLDCLKKIEVSSQHLLALVNEVLDMSRIESGRMSFYETEFNLMDLLKDFLSVVQTQVMTRSHKLLVNIHDIQHETVVGDKVRIHQVFANIVSNAVKYTPNGGKISIEFSEKEKKETAVHYYEFIVEDNGIGMSDEFIKHLFDPFVRASESVVNQIHGTGLGMSITKSIIDMMNGTIDVESHLGEGTKFTVTFCLKKAEVNIKPTYNSSLSLANSVEYLSKQNYSGKRVLVVEDNELNREIVVELLEMAHLKIEEAENGKIAVEMFEKSTIGYYDLIFMDIQMPILNGYQATSAIRALNRSDAKTIPIVAMTANAFAEDIAIAKNAGMNEHLTKPLEISKIIAVLDKVIH
ncbi:MAG: hybrid sensor histidine kinase/response regulator [Acutalibacteraceae bacterium]